MSRLLIGVSSPIAYSYLTESGDSWATPVLESPVSYCLLYDELWFLTRTVCPPEIENEDFVHFVDEDLEIKLPFDSVPEEETREGGNWDWPHWQDTVDVVTGDGREYRCDNHARPIEFSGLRLLPTPGSRANLFVDRYLAKNHGFVLAENTPNATLSKEFDTEILKMKISERLVGSRIGSPQAPFGFWHPCLSDLRSEAFLADFRRKIEDEEPIDVEGADRRFQELTSEYESELRNSLLKRFDYTNLVYSGMTTLIGMLPGVAQTAGPVTWLKSVAEHICDRKGLGWTAFLARVEKVAPKEDRGTGMFGSGTGLEST